MMISKTVRHFVTEHKAVAAVEFALILPLMLVLYIGSIEASQLISADRRVASVASSVGDLVARVNGQITTAELNDYFQAAEMIMRPYSSDSLGQLVTLVYVDEDGNTEVTWSEGYNGATEKTTGASYPLPSEFTDIARDNYVVVSETQMAYQPWLGFVIESEIDLYRQYFHMPRFGKEIELEP